MKTVRSKVFFVYLCLFSSSAIAIDSGNLYRMNPEKRVHTSMILEEEVRHLSVTSPGILERVGRNYVGTNSEFTQTELVDKITSYNLLFRTSLYLGEDMTVFGDVGLFNDVEAVVQAPLFAGGGGRITQEVFPDTYISVFGKGYVTTAYRYQLLFQFGDPWGNFQAAFDGRFMMLVAGAVITNHIHLESIDFYPYIGGEASFLRGQSELNDLRFAGATATLIESIDRGERDVSVKQKDLFHLILGVTLKRSNDATIRVETKVAPKDSTISIELGLFL